MKNKNLLIIIAFAFCSIGINAQTTQKLKDPILVEQPIIDEPPATPPDYYTGKDIISGNGFSFKKINEYTRHLQMRNSNNVKFGTSPYISLPPPIDGEEHVISYLNAFARFNDQNQVYSAVRDALGTAVINQFKTDNNWATIEIGFIVNMNGTVAELEFVLKKDSLLFSIPPEKFYSLESLLKQRVTFTVRQASFLKFIPGVIARVRVKDL